MTTRPNEREQNIHALRQSGATLSAIGEQHQLSRERVRQIIHRVERRRAQMSERNQWLEEAGLIAMADDKPKLEEIALQLDKIERELDEMTTVYDLPADVLELGTRAVNVIHNLGIATVGDLLRWSEADLLRIPNMGRRTVREVQLALAHLGYSLPEVSRLAPKENELIGALRSAQGWRQIDSLMRAFRQSAEMKPQK